MLKNKQDCQWKKKVNINELNSDTSDVITLYI